MADSTPPPPPFQAGYNFAPSEIVNNLKLEDIVNLMVINYPALQQALVNSGSVNPNGLVRFVNDQLQLRNADTGFWHSIWVAGQPGEEEIVVGQGTT